MALIRPRPLEAWSLDEGPPVRVVFTDIDDTLTDRGRVGPEAYRALWDLHEAGIAVVVVTGRPAGWCDAIARQWPVAGVVGENGALAFACTDGGMWRCFAAQDPGDRLAPVRDAVLREVPRARVAADQPYRQFDLAIDFAEDGPRLDDAEIERIAQVFREHGATAKISSIHVNGWFGQFDKLSMIRRFARERLALDLDGEAHRSAVYVGDSPNDCPAFSAFERSVGVANVLEHPLELDPPPAYVTRAARGEGFVELAQHVLAAARNLRQPESSP